MPTPHRQPPPRTATAAVLVIIGLDLASKWAAQALHAAGRAPGWITPVQNPDFTLGLASAPRPIMLALSTAVLLSFGGHCLRAARAGRLPMSVPVLLLAGATANLIDRAGDGAVEDFLLTPWAVVNLADLAVLTGLLAYTAALLPAGAPSQMQPRHPQHEPPPG